MYGEPGGWPGRLCKIFTFYFPDSEQYPDSFDVWIYANQIHSPGRYYAVAVMKVIIGQIVLNYDCQLADSQASRYFTWRSTMLPKESTMVILTPRSTE